MHKRTGWLGWVGAALCSSALAQADGGRSLATSTNVLPEVTVVAEDEEVVDLPAAAPGGQVATGARMGMLGNRPVLDTPLSVTSFTAQNIEDNQSRSVADVIADDPAVSMASARSNINEDLTIRGFSFPSGDAAFNGMFGLLPFWRVPVEAAERVEVLRGPSAALYGMSPSGGVGGVVNLVPKRAGKRPLSRVTLSATSDSTLGAHADIGRRFGVDNAFGLRLNAAHRQGDTAIRDQSTRNTLGALGLDLQQPRWRASADLQWNKERIDNVVRQIQPDAALTELPRAPDARIAYPGMGWTDGHSSMVLLKGEYDITDQISAYAGWGKRAQRWGAVAFNPRVTNVAGDYVYQGGWQRMNVDDNSAEAGLRGKFRTGAVGHDITLGMTQLRREQTLGFYTGFAPGSANIYTGNNAIAPSIDGIDNPLLPWREEKFSSLALSDTLSLMDERLLLTLGLRRQRVQAQNYATFTGVPSGPYYDKTATTPFAGVVFKLQPQTSLYASYVEGLSRGDTAPVDPNLSNPGEMLPPSKTKQKEVGLKMELGRTLATVGLFEITRPSSGISGNTFGLFGQQRNRGLEATLAGEAVPGLRLIGGMAYTDATLTKATDAAMQGKKAVGVPKWQMNLGAQWDTPWLPGLTLNGRLIHTGKAQANRANTLQLPSWQRLDAGLRYSTRIGGKETVLRLNVENLLGKNYWGISSAGFMFVGTPRTFSLSAGIDF